MDLEKSGNSRSGKPPLFVWQIRKYPLLLPSMNRHILLILLLLLTQSMGWAEHVIVSGGPSLKRWERYRVPEDQHDRWWANFIRGGTLRISRGPRRNPADRRTTDRADAGAVAAVARFGRADCR